MDSTLFKKMLEKDRVFEFLVRLNADLDEVRGRILGKEPLTSTREVFLEVRRGESRKMGMMGKNPVGVSSKNPALNTMTIETAAAITNKKMQQKVEDNDNIWCDFCNKPQHTKGTC